MASVNYQHKLAFVHIYKTGGTTVRHVLQKYLCSFRLVGADHDPLVVFRNICVSNDDLEEYERLYKFAVVRNPYDWLISIYSYLQSDCAHSDNKIVRKLRFSDFLKWFALKIADTKSPYRRQVDFICDSNLKILVDEIWRYECLVWMLLSFMVRYGVTKEYKDIPRLIQSKRKFSNIQDYYTSPSDIKLVQQIFEADFDLLGYNRTCP